MARTKFRLRRIKRFLSVVLFLAMFLGAGLLPPTFAYMTAENSIVQSLPEAQNLVEQGRKFYEAQRFADAVTSWQQAISAFKVNGDQLKQAMTLGNISLAYQQLGQWTEGESAIAQSLNLLQTSQNINTKERSQILAQVLDIKGRLQLALGKAKNALNTWRQAVDIYAKIGYNNAIIRNQINQAQALQALGLYRQAQRTLCESTRLLQNQPDSPLKVTALRSLGNVLRVTGNLEASQQVDLEASSQCELKTSQQILEQSLTVASSLQDKQAIADVLLSLGNTARAQQKIPAAIEFYRQAANAATSPTTRINAQVNQLRLLQETEKFSAVEALLPQIQTQMGDLPPSRTAIYAQVNFAESLMMGKKGEEGTSSPSSEHIRTSTQLLTTAVLQAKSLQDKRTESYALGVLGGVYEQTKQWRNAQNLTQQALFMAQAIDAKDIAYRWQWQLGHLLQAQGDIKGAIAAYEQAVKTLQSLRYDLVSVNPEVQFSFRDRVEPVYRQLVELLLRSSPGGIAQENLQKARETLESLQLAELDNFFRQACLLAKRQIDQVIDQEDQTAAAIYPIILPDRLEVILKLPQKPLLHYATALPKKQVESILDRLRQNLIEPDTQAEAKSLSQQMYNWLIKPAATELAQSNVKTLVFVLDGSLRNIPMAALYDGKQYLIEKYGIALTPGLQLVDPKPLQEEKLKALAVGLTEQHGGFSALPNVKRELEGIQSQIPSSILVNNEFTSKALQNKINSQPFSVVHLATHGQFSSKAEETFIVAWDKRIYVKQLNNLVRTRDTTRPEAIELLVLSACETASGDNRAALGIAGVALRAGARSTIASLWNLDDESTAQLMSKFYQELANKALTKVEALRRAQLALLQNPKYQRPVFWAPYILLGNWL